MKPFCGQWKDWMVLITSPGDWILTGGKLIRCTVDRNITCLQEEERKDREEEKNNDVHDHRQRKWESRSVSAPPSLCWEEMREGRRSCMRRKDSAIKGWFMACLLRCDLRVKERLFVECLLAGNLLHRFGCHVVVAWWSVYMLAQGIKIRSVKIYMTVSPWVCFVCLLCRVANSWILLQHIICFSSGTFWKALAVFLKIAWGQYCSYHIYLVLSVTYTPVSDNNDYIHL